MMTEISYSGYRFPPSLAVGRGGAEPVGGPDRRCRRQSDDAGPCHKESQAIPLLLASLLAGDHLQAQKGMRVPAGDIEGLVLDRLRALFSSRIEVSDALASLHLEARALDAALRNAFGLSERWLAAPPVEMKCLVRDIVGGNRSGRSDRNPAEPGEGRRGAGGGRTIERFDLDPVVVSIEAKLQRGGKEKRLVIENGAGAEVNAGLAAMIAEAFAIRNQLLSGSDDNIEAMTERLGIGKGHLTSLVRLSYLAPDIVRALLKGRQPIDPW